MSLIALADILEQGSEPVTESGCRIWMGGVLKSGYGRIRFDGRQRLTHRAAWEDVHGSIPPKSCICHRCDVPSCINIEHLFLGTQRDNLHDGIRKGRVNGPEQRAAMSKKNKGSKRSPEICARIGAGQMGHAVTAETREKLRLANLGNSYGLGYKHTEEECAKMRGKRMKATR